MTSQLKTMAYWGGKNSNWKYGTGSWVTQFLPYDRMYVEPFAGMLGVLLQRKKSRVEIANDLDGLLYSYWKCVRDYPEELGHKLTNTPTCRRTFEHAKKMRDDFIVGKSVDLVEIAHSVAVILQFGFNSRVMSNSMPILVYGSRKNIRNVGKNMEKLHQRIIGIEIENVCVLKLLDRMKDVSDAVIYCDPPYPSKKQNEYNFDIPDMTDFIALLKKQKGKVAVSSYDGDFDCLDWNKECLDVQVAKTNNWGDSEKDHTLNRVEALWTNYKPENQQTLFDL